MPGASIRVWQWPNVLGLDAACIAMAWLKVFAMHAHTTEYPGAAAYIVLGLSVWLTYLADRLFDVRERPFEALLSARHRFAKFHSRKLWTVWGLLLSAALLTAVNFLQAFQLRNGFWLLIVALIYSLLNQLCSKHFFPKEIIVAAIFTAGTQVFLSAPQPNLPVLLLALLCLTNCLAIAERERAVDARLRVHSLAGHLSPGWLWTLIASTCVLATLSPLASALIPSAAALALFFYYRDSIPTETYRVLCDGALLLGPLFHITL
jgi:hypothetical protein